MTTPVKLVIDLSKPEGEREQLVPLTQAEIEQAKRDAEEYEARKAALEIEEQARIQARSSALEKLSKLGLTEEEANAILG